MKFKSEIFPVLGKLYSPNDYTPLDLSSIATAANNIRTESELAQYIKQTLQQTSSKIAWGGYLEQRRLYTSGLFFNSQNPRDIHLGIDLWAESGTAIYAPLNGHIHSFGYNGAELDYGYTLILSHSYEGNSFYTLYGHLSSDMEASWMPNKPISIGDKIASIGKQSENGGWLPHLHFQLILNLEGMRADYPGVCAQKDLSWYRKNCPDPVKFCLPEI